MIRFDDDNKPYAKAYQRMVNALDKRIQTSPQSQAMWQQTIGIGVIERREMLALMLSQHAEASGTGAKKQTEKTIIQAIQGTPGHILEALNNANPNTYETEKAFILRAFEIIVVDRSGRQKSGQTVLNAADITVTKAEPDINGRTRQTTLHYNSLTGMVGRHWNIPRKAPDESLLSAYEQASQQLTEAQKAKLEKHFNFDSFRSLRVRNSKTRTYVLLLPLHQEKTWYGLSESVPCVADIKAYVKAIADTLDKAVSILRNPNLFSEVAYVREEAQKHDLNIDGVTIYSGYRANGFDLEYGIESIGHDLKPYRRVIYIHGYSETHTKNHITQSMATEANNIKRRKKAAEKLGQNNTAYAVDPAIPLVLALIERKHKGGVEDFINRRLKKIRVKSADSDGLVHKSMSDYATIGIRYREGKISPYIPITPGIAYERGSMLVQGLPESVAEQLIGKPATTLVDHPVTRCMGVIKKVADYRRSGYHRITFEAPLIQYEEHYESALPYERTGA